MNSMASTILFFNQAYKRRGVMKIYHRISLWIATLASVASLEALPGDIPELIPSDNVQRFNSVLPVHQEPTAQLLALDWQIQFRTYFDYQGPYDGKLVVKRKIVDDGLGWSQYEYQGIRERHVSDFELNSGGIVTARHDAYFDPETNKRVALRSTAFAYDHEGRIVQEHVSDADKQLRYVKLYYYNKEGQLWESVDPLQRVTQYSYEDNATIIEPVGSKTRARLLYENGRVVEEQFVTNGNTLSYVYDYDDEGHLINVTVPGRGNIIITRDPYHREIFRVYPDGSSIAFGYDDFGRTTHEVHYSADGEVASESYREYAGFRVVKETDLKGNVMEFFYDAGGRETERIANGFITTSSYDSLGRLEMEVNSDGSSIHYVHDLLDRLIEKRWLDANGIEIKVETFDYPIYPERVFDDWVYIESAPETEDENDDFLEVPAELVWMQQSVHEQVNAYRAEKGLPPLTLDPFLTSLCQQHCLAMASGEVEPGHDGIAERAQEARDYYGGTLNFGKNVALNLGFSDPPTVAVEGWINSSGHERQMVGSFELTGIGVAHSGGMYYFTQIFVTPKS